MKLADMGTTGLIEYLRAAKTGMQRGLRFSQVRKVLIARYGNDRRMLDRFVKACSRYGH